MTQKEEKNQKVIENQNIELEVNLYSKKSYKKLEYQKINLLCPQFRNCFWTEFDKRYYCQDCHYII